MKIVKPGRAWKRTYAAGLGAVLLMGALMWMALGALPPQRPPSTDEPPPAEGLAGATAQRLPLPRARSGAIEVSRGEQASMKVPSAEAAKGGETARARVLQRDPKMEDYKFFERKVLRTAEEQKSFEQMLSDEKRLQTARERLLSSDERTLSKELELERMYQVDYLSEALRWKENALRAPLLAAVEEIILADNLRADLPLELRRSRAGDKLELLAVLQETTPERAAVVFERAKGTHLEKLLQFGRQSTPPGVQVESASAQ